MKAVITVFALCVAMLCAGNAQAGYLDGAVYIQANPFAGISTVSQAVGDITGTPSATFQSTLINNPSISPDVYSGQDGSSLATSSFVGDTPFLGTIPADAATASANPSPLGSFVMNLTGSITVSATGNYTFTDNNDDGGAFFVSPGYLPYGGPGSGIIQAENDGVHGTQLQSSVLGLSAGQTYNLEYVYYNQGCIGCGFTGNADNSGGGAVAFGSIVGPGVVSFSPNLVPEPASLVLFGMGGIGMLWAVRRRHKS